MLFITEKLLSFIYQICHKILSPEESTNGDSVTQMMKNKNKEKSIYTPKWKQRNHGEPGGFCPPICKNRLNQIMHV